MFPNPAPFAVAHHCAHGVRAPSVIGRSGRNPSIEHLSIRHRPSTIPSSMNRVVVVAVTVAALVGATVLTWMGVRREREFRRLIVVGEAALARGQTFEAIEAFSGAVPLKPDAMLPYLKRGDTYRKRGDYTAAARDLLQATRFDATAPQPLELLGDVNAALGRHDRAADDYRRYIALDDRAPRVLYKLALAYHHAGQDAAAIDPLHRAIGIDDKLTEAHYLLALCLRERRNTTDALRELTRAVAISPTFAPAREQLADLYASLGRRREGLEQLEALAALEPSRPERLVEVGLSYSRLGRTDAALLVLERAADQYPDDATVATALGRVWLEQADSQDDPAVRRKAIDALRRVVARTSPPTDALVLYGRALMVDQQLDAAERALQQASTRLPIDPIAFRYLSQVATRLGHAQLARDANASYVALT